MFCGKCGAQIPDNSSFCPSCGANTSNTNQNPAANNPANPSGNPMPNPSAPNRIPFPGANRAAAAVTGTNKNQIIGIAAVAAIVVLVLILLISCVGGRGYKKTAEKFVESTMEADAKGILKLIPKKVKSATLENMGYDKKDTAILAEELEDSLDYSYGFLDAFADDWSYKYKVKEVENYSTKSLRDTQRVYKDEYDVKVKKAKIVTIELTIKYGDDEEYTEEMDVGVVKIGKSWYIDIADINNLL